MPNKTNIVYIFWTCRSNEEAKKIIRNLLSQRLIACASIFPEIESLYRWRGAIEKSKETKVILKTKDENFSLIKSYIKEHCSYEEPEIVKVSISEGSNSYISWILQETKEQTFCRRRI